MAGLSLQAWGHLSDPGDPLGYPGAGGESLASGRPMGGPAGSQGCRGSGTALQDERESLRHQAPGSDKPEGRASSAPHVRLRHLDKRLRVMEHDRGSAPGATACSWPRKPVSECAQGEGPSADCLSASLLQIVCT